MRPKNFYYDLYFVSQESACDHEEELQRLKIYINELEGDNAALRIENQERSSRVESLVMDLSIKEATWCQAEERAKQEVS